MATTSVRKGATISGCGLYRYDLTRTWDDTQPPLVFVMLNPSTADALEDDATIRKCIGFADLSNFGGIVVVNLYAFRATKPASLWNARRFEGVNIVGPENHDHIVQAVSKRCVVLAWGAHGRRDLEYTQAVTRLIENNASLVRALRLLADDTPAHPLYLPYDCAKHMIAL